jgi:hypothetical protein
MASGEMSRQEYVEFLIEALGNAATHSRAGAVHYVCTDWRHFRELGEAGQQTYVEMLNLAVWVKSNAGQGSFYRSQHELIGVFRVGEAPHLNNIELGRHGRSRSNVWRYGGANSFRAGRMDELRAHPTPKPVALAADAMKDYTSRGHAPPRSRSSRYKADPGTPSPLARRRADDPSSRCRAHLHKAGDAGQAARHLPVGSRAQEKASQS